MAFKLLSKGKETTPCYTQDFLGPGEQKWLPGSDGPILPKKPLSPLPLPIHHFNIPTMVLIRLFKQHLGF